MGERVVPMQRGNVEVVDSAERQTVWSVESQPESIIQPAAMAVQVMVFHDRSSMVEHPPFKRTADGSSPSGHTMLLWCKWLAHHTFNVAIRVRVPVTVPNNTQRRLK